MSGPRPISEHYAVRGESFFDQVIEVVDYGNRIDLFRGWATGRKVLHVGCADFPLFDAQSNLHLQLAPVAAELVGLDTSVEGVALLRAHFGGRYYHDLAELAGEHFDLVLMPETIEHIGNAEQALSQIFRALRFEEFVLTAPCYRYWGPKTKYENGRFYSFVHPDHYAWYCPSTLRRLLRDVLSPADLVEFFLVNDQNMVGARIVRRT